MATNPSPSTRPNGTQVQVAQPSLPSTATRIGQGTAVEQSRAVAEVHAAILVAQQCPRNVQTAVTAMQMSCRQQALAERAFYRYSRGGSAISGPSVHLARELARCWGNVQYGEVELRRDDDYGQSEMQAFAWDVETNTRSVRTFIVPHTRHKKVNGEKVKERLDDSRDIYETNANAAARRLREAIFSILPPWFVEQAKDLCHQALEDGGGKPLPTRIADAIAKFGEMGITEAQLVQKQGRASKDWTEHDVAQLVVVFKSLARGEIGRDEEFPPPKVTGEEIANQKGQPKPSGGES